ncbi:MAG: hypothetical protein ACRDMJ_17365 [Solirubrobacteraceae bacterium]
MSTIQTRHASAVDDLHQPLPPRPRRRLLTRGTVAMAALLACAIGFYVGVRVEKGRFPASSSSSSATATRSGTGAAGGGRAGLAALFAGRGGGAGGATFGTVSTVSGRTLYVTGPTGNTVKVKLTSATKIAKTRAAGRSSIRPGDSVVVQGISGSGATVTAASVTDSGARAGATTSASGSSPGSSSGASGSVGSLFTPGG